MHTNINTQIKEQRHMNKGPLPMHKYVWSQTSEANSNLMVPKTFSPQNDSQTSNSKDPKYMPAKFA